MRYMSLAAIAILSAVFTGCAEDQQVEAVPQADPEARSTEIRSLDSISAVDEEFSQSPALEPEPEPELSPTRVPVVEAPEPVPTQRTYIIQQGDTFFGIARRLYNNPARAKEIQALNPSVDPRKLRIGQEIIIPVD